jgi:hypothetical protein
MTKSYEDQLANIQARTQAIAKRENELAQLRHRHALGAVNGEQTAIDIIRNIEDETRKLDEESKTLNAAVASIHDAQAEAKAEIAARDLERKQHETAERIKNVQAKDCLIDGTISLLVKQLYERREDLRSLIKLGLLSQAHLQRLAGKFGPTGAARFHGLQEYIGIEHVSPEFTQALVEAWRESVGA